MELKGLYIAHRGLHNCYNENTFQAIKKAVDMKIPYELDIHITKDKVIVVSHDNNLERMTGKSIEISNSNYNDIKDIRIKHTTEFLTTLNNVLEYTNGKVLIDIEIKKEGKNFIIENELIKILDNYKGDFIIKSFNTLSLLYIKKKRPKYIVGLLISKKSSDNVFKKIIDKISLSLINFDFYSPNIDMLPDIEINNKNKPIIAWTIDTDEKLRKAYKYADSYLFEKINIIR